MGRPKLKPRLGRGLTRDLLFGSRRSYQLCQPRTYLDLDQTKTSFIRSESNEGTPSSWTLQIPLHPFSIKPRHSFYFEQIRLNPFSIRRRRSLVWNKPSYTHSEAGEADPLNWNETTSLIHYYSKALPFLT